MKDLTKIYLDLSKCTEEERKHIFSLLPEKKVSNQYDINDFDYNLSLYKNGIWWVFNDLSENKTELTYPEFIKLFEGGEDYPGKKYQPLFNHLNQEHGLILHAREMDEIIRIVNNLNSNQ